VEYYTLIINTGKKEIKLMDVVVLGSTCSHNNLAYNRECWVWCTWLQKIMVWFLFSAITYPLNS